MEPRTTQIMPSNVLADIVEERHRQTAEYGQQSLPDGTGNPCYAETARLCQTVNAALEIRDAITWLDVLKEEYYEAMAESDPVRLRAELVQIAAVSVAWIEDIDRRSNG